MAQSFDSFVMFAEMRTGSNFLEANLNAMPGIVCHGEAFNPHFIGKKDQMAMCGIDMVARALDPMALVRAMRANTTGLAGFRFFHDHDPRVMAAVLGDVRCAKIILTRNPVESYVSWKIAQATGQWKLTNAKNLKQAKARFDAAEFEAHLDAVQAFQRVLLHGLQSSGQTAFYIDYDDIGDVAVLNGLARFLGVAAEVDAADDTLKVQNPEPVEEKVSNPAEMAAALARLDRFNLGRTPNFEPRRHPAIPGYTAAAAAGLLYMPVRGGPQVQVVDWLARVGSGGVIGDFVQKSLRQWKRTTLPQRSFTVLRHPVARAFGTFRNKVLTGEFAEVRNQLVKAYKVDLPDPGAASDAALRAAFLGYLRFAKLIVAGQAGIKANPHLASQAAVVQGFAGFMPPDVVLREDRLAQGLAFLAAEVGVDAPAYHAAPAAEGLAAIYDAEVEEAVREAYARDYATFGFGNYAAG